MSAGAEAVEDARSADPPRSTSRRDRRIAVVAIVVAALVIGAVVVLKEEQAATSSGGAGSAPTVLAAAQTKWVLAPGYYEQVSFDLRIAATITGGLFASAGGALLILNSTDYQSFNQTGNTTSHTYSAEISPSLTLDTSLTEGSWYLIVSNMSPTATTNVTVTSAIVATAAS